MREFAEAFLLVFAELAVGGLFSLSIPPFHQIERGFYKSTAAVYLAAGAVALSGWSYLLATRGVDPASLSYRLVELAIWGAFLAVFTVYFRSLWGEHHRLRARSYTSALLLGFIAVAATALRYSPPTIVGFALYPVAFGASALLLGAASTGMLLGHWYLIDVGLTLTPLLRVQRFFVTAIHLQMAISALTVVSALAGMLATGSLARLWENHSLLVILRVSLGPVAAYGLAWMIRRTLAVPQTMAATGLFYIAVLSVVVGEILGRTILFRTSLPL